MFLVFALALISFLGQNLRRKCEAAIHKSRLGVIAMTFEDVANSTVQQTLDQGRKTAEEAGQVLKDSYNAAQQYAEDKGLNLNLGDLVRREPWLAVAAAFAIGYVAAAAIRRVS